MRALLWPWLALTAMFLRWTIYEAETYLLACARDGLTDSLSLREFRAQIDADRVRLADIQQRMFAATRSITGQG